MASLFFFFTIIYLFIYLAISPVEHSNTDLLPMHSVFSGQITVTVYTKLFLVLSHTALSKAILSTGSCQNAFWEIY